MHFEVGFENRKGGILKRENHVCRLLIQIIALFINNLGLNFIHKPI